VLLQFVLSTASGQEIYLVSQRVKSNNQRAQLITIQKSQPFDCTGRWIFAVDVVCVLPDADSRFMNELD
jgi:hypothetical protein